MISALICAVWGRAGKNLREITLKDRRLTSFHIAAG
nr:MAG TPA: hypothetical protein [Caudoviricetes sp.]